MIPSKPSRFVLTVSLLLSLFTLALADTPILRMARLSVIEGEVSYRRANHDQNSWYDATTNTPLGENDQVFTGQRGRAEIQLSGRNIVRLDGDTSFKITQFTTAVTHISLPVGTAVFRIDSLDRRQFDIVEANDPNRDDPLYFEVNTPTVAVTLLKTGIYRIRVEDDGTTEVIVRSGEAEVYNQELDTLVVKKGRRIVIEGNDPADYRIAKLEDKDAFDRWNERRDDDLAIQADSLSARYVPQGIPGVYDLDRYGDWWHTDDHGYVWSPRSVAAGWSPYRVGAWRWYSDWGWTWISTEPWGWTPYHYGRWSHVRNRWCWIPRSGVSVGFSWSPALVTWFGWGNGYNRGYNNGYRDGYRDGRYDAVGWIPLGPGERYYNPHWRGGNTTIVNNTNIYGNGNTVINQRLDSYRNYNAPGGITRMDGRRFDTHRVAVNNIDNTPIQQPVIRSAITARGDSFRPAVGLNTQPTVNPAADPTNRPVTQRQVISRGFNRGANPANSDRRGTFGNGTPTLRNADVPDRMARPDRVNRDAPNPGQPTNRVDGDATRGANRAGNTDTTIVTPRNDERRNERRFDPDYRRVERNPERPPADRSVQTPRTTEPPSTDRTDRTQRPAVILGDTNRGENNNRGDYGRRDENRRDSNPPVYTPRRNETERREAPPRYEAPRQEAPRETRREERSAPREERSMPREQPRYERPSSPPPRQEAPRQEARPSSPPTGNPGGGDRTERPARRPPQ